jgi:hypothetical protein
MTAIQYLSCQTCGAPMRPARTSGEDHPDTVAMQSKVECSHCYHVRRVNQIDRFDPIPAQRWIEAYVADRRRRGINPEGEVLEGEAGDKNGRAGHRRAACKRGHPMEGENVWVDGRGIRSCLTCKKARQAAALAKYRAEHQTPRDDPAKTCRKGHPYTAENTMHRPQGGRQCRICYRERQSADRPNAVHRNRRVRAEQRAAVEAAAE